LRHCLHNMSYEIKWNSLVASLRESLKNFLFSAQRVEICYAREKLDPRKVVKARKTAAPRYKKNEEKNELSLLWIFECLTMRDGCFKHTHYICLPHIHFIERPRKENRTKIKCKSKNYVMNVYIEKKRAYIEKKYRKRSCVTWK